MRVFYLYDPRTNITTKTTYKELEGISGMSTSSLSHAKTLGRKLKPINCYFTDEEPNLKIRRIWYAKETHPDEAWIKVKGTKNTYHVSNYGRVKRIYKNSEMFLLPFRKKDKGNLLVKIDGKETVIGHLVSNAFLRERNTNERVYRKNGIITDDYVGNLEIVTVQKLGKLTGHTSRNIPIVQLDFKTKKYINEFNSIREAGRELHISHEAIRHNVIGRSKRCNDFVFVSLKVYERLGQRSDLIV